MGENVAEGASSNGTTPRPRGRPVATPKALASSRLLKLREHATKTRERLRGFGLDQELADLESYVVAIEGMVAAKPADFKPSRASRQGPQVESGQRWRLKEDAIKKYWGTLEKPIAEFAILNVVDSTQVQVRFDDGTRCIVKRSDIGDKLEVQNARA